MRNCIFITVTVVFFVFLPAVAQPVRNPAVGNPAIQNPAVQSPVGSATVPPSSFGNALVRSANPIDSSSNLAITGDIGGGRHFRHFRGILPYRSTWSFRAADATYGAAMDSSYFDSFLRRSASIGDWGRYSGAYTPYRSPSRTVTTTAPGYSAVIRPPAPGVGGFKRGVDTIGVVLPEVKTPTVWTPSYKLQTDDPIRAILRPVSDRRDRPLSMTTEQLEKVLSEEATRHLPDQTMVDQPRDEQLEQFKRDLRLANDKIDELKRSLIGQSDDLQLPTETEPSKDVPQPFGLQELKKRESKYEHLDVYEKMKRKIDSYQKSFESPYAQVEGPSDELAEGSEKLSEKILEQQKSGEKALKIQDLPAEQDFLSEQGLSLKQDLPEGQQESQKDKLSDKDLAAAKARVILGTHKSFVSYLDDKFNKYMLAAETYLRLGRYYRAADAYTMASYYKPDDPLSYAGKGHALFVAGEFMSSALFISRAIEMFPEYVRFKVDLIAMLGGDRDIIENRLFDVRFWLDKSNAPELKFLLSYIYYQMGRIEWAKNAIEITYKDMPDSKAVVILRKAIDAEFKASTSE